jgi:hypothetical protein
MRKPISSAQTSETRGSLLVIYSMAGLGAYGLNCFGLSLFSQTELIFGGFIGITMARLHGAAPGAVIAAMLGTRGHAGARAPVSYGCARSVADLAGLVQLKSNRRVAADLSAIGSATAEVTRQSRTVHRSFRLLTSAATINCMIPAEWIRLIKHPINAVAMAACGDGLVRARRIRAWLRAEPLQRGEKLRVILGSLSAGPVVDPAHAGGAAMPSTARSRASCPIDGTDRNVCPTSGTPPLLQRGKVRRDQKH